MSDPEKREHGASMVEFAIILPLFVLLLFGMIEAGWAFAQANDVRHGAREGARMAAINDLDTVEAIGAEVCGRMELAGSPATSITFRPLEVNDDGDGGRNGKASIAIDLTYSSITGTLDSIFGGMNIGSDIEFRMEQPVNGEAVWWTEVGLGGSTVVTCP